MLWSALCSALLLAPPCELSASARNSGAANYPKVFLQSVAVTGKVTDDAGVGVPGINIIVKGASIGTTSDADGVYNLNLPSEQSAGTLVFSFIGYTTQEVPINND